MVRPLVAVGVAAVAVGFVAAVDRGVAAALDPSTTVVTLIGALGAVQGLRYANARRNRTREAAAPGDPERRAPASVPGADLDERIERATGPALGGHRARREVRDRVRELAVAAVARDRNAPTDAAEDLVETGEWTDDATAAAFLAPRSSYPVRVRVRAMVSGRSRYESGLRAAVDALDRLEDGEPEDCESEAER
ncbi:hypothetical protein [Halorubrum sp. CBA1229]|uniref:DUF7269 family protein n=1 Tax=Halorubrum sp. CBA1229 TaxID=1853699 RepID=UPI000F3E7314|nr:hypothetical protein [Halorubrum sp. CBA1229]QKY16098.1 hypothetical protein Hrr1229_004080 [Halorubrum sp. CBA1229]